MTIGVPQDGHEGMSGAFTAGAVCSGIGAGSPPPPARAERPFLTAANNRAWRAGCYGNVASVLIEKPPCGDFLPLVDGGFALQFSPQMAHREGKGMVLFCQMDVTGRTERDPAAMQVVSNVLNYASSWKATPRRTVLYAGDATRYVWGLYMDVPCPVDDPYRYFRW